MLQAYVYGKGRVPLDSSQFVFSDPVKLTSDDGFKINVGYGDNKFWSLSLPKFFTSRVSSHGKWRYLCTKYPKVVDSINQLVDPFAKYLYENREKLGIDKSEEEIQFMLKKSLFLARTSRLSSFVDIATNKQMDLENLKTRFQAKVYVKPTIYVKEKNVYFDLIIVRATLSTHIEPRKENKEVSVTTS